MRRAGGLRSLVLPALFGVAASAWLTSSQVDLQQEPAGLREPSGDVRELLVELAGPDHRIGRRAWLFRRALLAADAAAFAATLLVLRLTGETLDSGSPWLFVLGFCGFCAWVLFAQGYGLYRNDEIQAARPTADDVPGVILLVTLVSWLGMLALGATGVARPRIAPTAWFWASAIVLVLAARVAARAVARHFAPSERTVIVGAGRVGSEIASKLHRRPEYGLEVIGFLDDDPLQDPLRAAGEGPPHLGDTSRIEDVLSIYRVERVIVAFSRPRASEQVDLLQRCLQLGVRVDIVPRLYEVIGPRMQAHDIEGLPLVGLPAPRLSRSSWLLKRCLDVVLSIATLVLLAPLFAYIALRIRLDSPGPVLFRQERIGAGGRGFRIIKFRTMTVGADSAKEAIAHLNKHTEDGPRMFKIPEDPRITRYGRVLRRWSADELPQLWNVLRGEMSLVGPRPLIPAEDENVVGLARQRLRLTPGITGLWQVVGRSDVPFREMITLDYLYVTNWSLWGDVKLLVQTLPRVLKQTGAY